MKRVDSIKIPNRRRMKKRVLDASPAAMRESKKITHDKTNQKNRLWIFSIISAIVVLIIWALSFKINWERINSQSEIKSKSETLEIEDLKSRIDDIINQTTNLLNQVKSPAPTSTVIQNNTTSKEIIFPENYATLTEEQIKQITKELKNESGINKE